MTSLYVLYEDMAKTNRRRVRIARGGIGGFIASFGQRLERRRAIRELASLPDRMLRDIGVERDQIGDVVDGKLAESRKSRRGTGGRPALRPADGNVAA